MMRVHDRNWQSDSGLGSGMLFQICRGGPVLNGQIVFSERTNLLPRSAFVLFRATSFGQLEIFFNGAAVGRNSSRQLRIAIEFGRD